MRINLLVLAACSLCSALYAAEPLVEFEKMTWPELKKAIREEGRTTALLFNGGTEQRGPQNTSGGHNLIARGTAIEIAKKLGNAIVAPVIPYSLNRANPELPGTIGISGPLFASLNEEVAEQLIRNGFRAVVLMGDHGGGQKELQSVAAKLDAKYAPEGIRIVYCGDVYEKANNEFNAWLAEHGYPASSHGGIPDTSEMLYLGGNDGWVRKELVATAVGDPPRARGENPGSSAPRLNNGISGDARRSTAELGKRFIDLKVDLAVKQIREFLTVKVASK